MAYSLKTLAAIHGGKSPFDHSSPESVVSRALSPWATESDPDEEGPIIGTVKPHHNPDGSVDLVGLSAVRESLNS